MAHRGQWLIQRSLSHAYKLETWVPPTNIYLRWFTSAVSEAGTGTEVSNVGTGYSATAVALGSTNFEFIAPDLIRTKLDINGGTPTGAAWGTLLWAAFFTAATGTTDLWTAGALTTPIPTVVGAPVILPAGTGFRHYGRQQATP